MSIPLFSIFSLSTEILVTVAILSVIYRAFYDGVFMRGLAFVTLGYELLFSITYMLSRVLLHLPEHTTAHHEPFELALAIFHGTFSLIMFVVLIVYFVVATRAYDRGENYFKNHPRITASFVAAWLVSIFSGILFFYLLYLSNHTHLQ